MTPEFGRAGCCPRTRQSKPAPFLISGANNIQNQRARVDELNVFPVPDGDTGTNMAMTVGASVPELEAMADSCTVAEASKTAASAMLREARQYALSTTHTRRPRTGCSQ